MTTFYIVRHGETENNRAGRFSGWVDTPLTEKGVQDALSAASKLRGITFDRVVSSDMGRAFTTAYIIVRRLGIQHDIERTKGLREVNYGDYANLPYTVYPSGMAPEQNGVFVPPNGESLAQMQQRVLACIADLSVASTRQTILLVAHDGTINAIRASYAAQDMGVADLSRNPHDSVAKFEYDNQKIVSFEPHLNLL